MTDQNSKRKNFYPLNIFPYLGKYHDTIVQEIKHIDPTKWINWPETDLYSHNSTPDWTIFPLYAFNVWVNENCEQCPTITKLLKNLRPGVLKTAVISKLGPQMVLKTHQGWPDLSNHILRCHYGIIVPDRCSVSVNSEVRPMQEQQWLIFDDSHYHTAFNMSNQDRYVLIIDLERPPCVPSGMP